MVVPQTVPEETMAVWKPSSLGAHGHTQTCDVLCFITCWLRPSGPRPWLVLKPCSKKGIGPSSARLLRLSSARQRHVKLDQFVITNHVKHALQKVRKCNITLEQSETEHIKRGTKADCHYASDTSTANSPVRHVDSSDWMEFRRPVNHPTKGCSQPSRRHTSTNIT